MLFRSWAGLSISAAGKVLTLVQDPGGLSWTLYATGSDGAVATFLGLVRNHNVASFSSISRGDIDAGFAEAHTVVKGRYVADGSHAAPIEPRAVVAQWEGNKVTIWSSTQVPFDARAGVCETLQLPASRVRIIVPHLEIGRAHV